MAHTSHPHHEQDPTSAGGVDVPAIALIGIVGTLLLIVIAIAAQAWFYDLRDATIARTQYAQPDAEVEAYKAEQEDLLSRPRWIEDREGEAAAIPIERAIEIYAAGE